MLTGTEDLLEIPRLRLPANGKRRAVMAKEPMRSLAAMALACLLASSAIDAAAAGGAPAPCRARNLGFDEKGAGWAHQPLSLLKRDTVYTLEREDGRTVLRGTADGSASLYLVRFDPAVDVPATLHWRWKTDALVPGADNRDRRLEDAPLRVIVGFDGDLSTLPSSETGFLLADLPYATLMYIWSDQVTVENVIPSAHTSRVKMLVVASGTGGLGRWQTVQRNIAADYQRAFGTAPGRVLSVAVMTDTDNTGEKAVGEYADIRFGCPPG
jgi:hypothetical protein